MGLIIRTSYLVAVLMRVLVQVLAGHAGQGASIGWVLSSELPAVAMLRRQRRQHLVNW